MQLGEPGRRRRERLDAEHTAVGVDRGGDVSVEVSVNPAGDRARLYEMVIAIPSLFKLVKGWHARPGKETVTIGLRQQADRSPSGTGRAHVWTDGPVDRHLHMLDATNQSDRNRRAADRSHPQRAGGGPSRAATPILTGISIGPSRRQIV